METLTLFKEKYASCKSLYIKYHSEYISQRKLQM